MSEARKTKSVRLSDEQISGLKRQAKKLSSQTGARIGWTTVVGIAVDRLLLKRNGAPSAKESEMA